MSYEAAQVYRAIMGVITTLLAVTLIVIGTIKLAEVIFPSGPSHHAAAPTRCPVGTSVNQVSTISNGEDVNGNSQGTSLRIVCSNGVVIGSKH